LTGFSGRQILKGAVSQAKDFEICLEGIVELFNELSTRRFSG
jgi:hypothetical protein